MLAAASWRSVMWCGATGCYVLLMYKSKAHEFNWEHFRSIEAHIDCAKRSWFELYTWIINNYVVLIYGAYAVWTWTWTILGGETYSISVEVEKWEWYGYWFCWFSGKRLIILMHYIYLMRTKLYLVPKAHTSVQLPPVVCIWVLRCYFLSYLPGRYHLSMYYQVKLWRFLKYFKSKIVN